MNRIDDMAGFFLFLTGLLPVVGAVVRAGHSGAAAGLNKSRYPTHHSARKRYMGLPCGAPIF